jgi:HlyD family secretion protein
MTRSRVALLVGLGVVVATTAWVIHARSGALVLTGIVTTDDVIVSPQVTGQIGQLLVNQGDSVVRDQVVARLVPAELQADQAYYLHSAEGDAQRVEQGTASLRYQELQTSESIHQAEALLASAVAQQAEATANLTNAKIQIDRVEALLRGGSVAQQEVDQARMQYAVAQSRSDAADKQMEAQRAALALANAAEQQVAMKRSELGASEQDRAAASAQRAKAEVRLAYTELRAPIAGIVDVKAARAGEVVTPGQPVITLIDPDALWIRADVEETYISRVRIGDTLEVRLPSGDVRRGAVFYRGVDAGYATQRDVSRSKRDIKTFEIRLRVDNRDRRLAVGMTAYVLLPAKVQEGVGT